VPSLKSLSLSVAVLDRFYCWYVTLCCDLDLWPLTMNICSIPASSRSNCVRNLSKIGQSAAELLQCEYLTLWPWTCITCFAMLWVSFYKVWTQSSYPFMKCNDFLMLRLHDTLWPWRLTPWPCTFVVPRASCVQTLYKIWAKSNKPRQSYWRYCTFSPSNSRGEWGTFSGRFSGVRGPNFIKLGVDTERSLPR